MGKYSERVMSKMPHAMKKARFNLEINRIFRAESLNKSRKEKDKTNMGYRSTVAYTIRFTPVYENKDSSADEALKQAKESFYTFLAEAKVKHSGCFSEEFGVEVDEPNMAINFLAEGVKWYEDYEDVKGHESLVQLSREWVDMENKHIGGIFMRIGEEMDDLVEDSWGEYDWEWMQLSRQIIVDWM